MSEAVSMTKIYYGENGYPKAKAGRPIVDLSGKRFGKLIVEKLSYRKVTTLKSGKQTTTLYWECKCECGNTTVARGNHLKDGSIVSCGCNKKYLNNTLGKRLYGQPHTPLRLYKVWKEMRRRCESEKDFAYKLYGGRGINVCDEWKNSFENFREWAFANGYDVNAKRGDCTIDRIDCNGNYEPTNCRWVDMKVQNNNRRNNRNRTEKVWLEV